MNPLSRVRPKCVVAMNDTTATMKSRPALAIKIAECIGEFAEVEFTLGSTLASLLGSETKIALAMFVGATSRNAQIGMLRSAAEAALPSDHLDVFSAIMKEAVTPAMKDRDKLAHWCWGYTPDLPDALLLFEPTQKTMNMGTFLLVKGAPLELNRDFIFVVTETDLTGMFERIRAAKALMGKFVSTIWRGNPDAKRAEFLQRLSDEPLVREALRQLRGRRKSAQAAPG